MMPGKQHITVCVAGRSDGDLSAYGAVLRFGEHHRERAGCYPLGQVSPITVLMEGVVAALHIVKEGKPCHITIISQNAHEIRSCLSVTPFPHLRSEYDRLVGVHEIEWHSIPEHQDILFCGELAAVEIGRYREAVAAVGPGIEIIRKAAVLFGVAADTRLSVRLPIGGGEGAGRTLGEPVWVSL